MATSLCYAKPLKPFSLRLPQTQNPQIPTQTTQIREAETLTITGPTQLSGHVPISGSKNSSLCLLAATLLCSNSCLLHNVPTGLSDTKAMLSILRSLGAKIEFNERNKEILVNTDGVGRVEPCLEEMRKIRGGFFVIGPLLARFGEAVVGLPGGCDIGERPVDLYVRGLRALGAAVEISYFLICGNRLCKPTISHSNTEKMAGIANFCIITSDDTGLQRDGRVLAHSANGKGLVGGSFHLDFPSVGATETLMMAASMADGVTVLSNVAKEPEVIDLARFLNDSGACVYGAGSDKLLIKGKCQLRGCECYVPPDRIEAGTFMLAAAITRSLISISPVTPSHLSCLIDKLKIAGCKITRCNNDTLEVRVSAIPENVCENLRGFNVRTSPFPGFPTDLQPPTMALLTTCSGSSIVEESVFDRRLGHVRELQKLGAKIQVCGSTALVFGRETRSALHGSQLRAADLRGGVALVLAGLVAEGTTQISGIGHIGRGYENLDTKLQFLGADIKRSIAMASQL
ncbi:EPSP synthase domain-containing protein [Citrus sinensis]|uniref:EPSP synthase domain-containing protein n=1 Tax=Citrus sinensis TaxID=2711 RepID=A0ACB8LZT6_CITSI|nr:EPSP synthase domain-containing protein [Citrus sinensis]